MTSKFSHTSYNVVKNGEKVFKVFEQENVFAAIISPQLTYAMPHDKAILLYFLFKYGNLICLDAVNNLFYYPQRMQRT